MFMRSMETSVEPKKRIHALNACININSRKPISEKTFKVDGKIDHEVMKPGEVVPLEDDEGQEIIGVVVEVDSDLVYVDVNHPLAGLDLHFEGVVVSIS